MSYELLTSHFRTLSHFQEVAAIVEWDQAVNMPEAAGTGRAEAMATLMSQCHQLLVEPRLEEWLSKAEQQADLGNWERANVAEMRRLVTAALALPSDLVAASTRAEKRSEQAWRRYRAANDYVAFAPYLSEVIKLKQETAAALGQALGCSPYDALLGQFEPGITTALVDRVFNQLRDALPSFTERVIERQQHTPVIIPSGPFPVAAQRELGLELMQLVGFSTTAGRLDVSHHPFCGGVPRDVRITTRYDESDFTSSLMGILHESGHAKYEQGLPEAWLHQPVGAARGMVVHESQSLLLEMQVCRSREFLAFAAPLIRKAFPNRVAQQPHAYGVDNLYALYTRVERSLIRVDADEVTYPSHVLLRYDLERALLSGALSVADLPDAWDAGMRELLGLTTAGNDKDGCMQDVHWPCGAFGYFPLYTLGATVAAQLFAAAAGETPELPQLIARGEFGPLNEWLRRTVWSRASSCTLSDLLMDATGEDLNAHHLLAHLTRRYGD